MAKKIAKTPTLFGLENSNREPSDFWGKNRFNSSFPAALACWMREKNINPVYIHTFHKKILASDEKITFNDVFNTSEPLKNLHFNFESKYLPFHVYSHDHLESMDLVICANGIPKRALEVKLTVLPDQTTFHKSEDSWGCELVIRPVCVIYAALTIYHSIVDRRDEAIKILEKTALGIDDWTNTSEVFASRNVILQTVEKFLDVFSDNQQPLILQPVWKTKGKLPELADQAFDIFVWSNMALCRLFLNQAKAEKKPKKVSRHLRASARLLRCLYDLFTAGKMRKSVITGMSLGHQTDKEFSASGQITSQYMRHPRLTVPKIPKTVLREIILNGGEKQLSPERRFDATIFFTATELFDK